MVYALTHKPESPQALVRMRFGPYGEEDPEVERQRYYIAGDQRRPLDGQRIPEIFHRHTAKILSSVRSLPDIWFKMDWIVNAEVKDIVESFEPGQHQFVPLLIRDKNDQPIERETFVFHPVGEIECIIPELSEVRSDRTPGREGKLSDTCADPDVTLDSAAIRGRHIWLDPRRRTEPFISDDLHAAFMKTKLRGGWDYRKHKVA
jgi:hypothetical protein